MSKMNKNPLIYITNDDGPDTKGLNKLIQIVSEITDNYWKKCYDCMRTIGITRTRLD